MLHGITDKCTSSSARADLYSFGCMSDFLVSIHKNGWTEDYSDGLQAIHVVSVNDWKDTLTVPTGVPRYII